MLLQACGNIEMSAILNLKIFMTFQTISDRLLILLVEETKRDASNFHFYIIFTSNNQTHFRTDYKTGADAFMLLFIESEKIYREVRK